MSIKSGSPSLDEVLPGKLTQKEDDHWKAYQKKRRKARQATALRVQLDG